MNDPKFDEFLKDWPMLHGAPKDVRNWFIAGNKPQRNEPIVASYFAGNEAEAICMLCEFLKQVAYAHKHSLDLWYVIADATDHGYKGFQYIWVIVSREDSMLEMLKGE